MHLAQASHDEAVRLAKRLRGSDCTLKQLHGSCAMPRLHLLARRARERAHARHVHVSVGRHHGVQRCTTPGRAASAPRAFASCASSGACRAARSAASRAAAPHLLHFSWPRGCRNRWERGGTPGGGKKRRQAAPPAGARCTAPRQAPCACRPLRAMRTHTHAVASTHATAGGDSRVRGSERLIIIVVDARTHSCSLLSCLLPLRCHPLLAASMQVVVQAARRTCKSSRGSAVMRRPAAMRRIGPPPRATPSAAQARAQAHAPPA